MRILFNDAQYIIVIGIATPAAINDISDALAGLSSS